MQKLTTPTDGENILVYGLLAFVVLIVIIYKLLVHNKRTVMRHNLAHERIIQTKNFAELIDVISSHEIRSQQKKLSDIIFTQFEKVVRKEFEKHKSSEDFISILKLFYNITTSYNWGNQFETPLYKEFCAYLEIYLSRLFSEKNTETLKEHVQVLNDVSLELGLFFQEKRSKSVTDITTQHLRKKFFALRRTFAEEEGMTAGA